MMTFRDTLSHLTYRQACKLIGPGAEQLIRTGGKYEIEINEQVSWEKDLFNLRLEEAVVTLSLDPERPKSLRFACSHCPTVCEHVGAAFSLILEEKLSLGPSAPPPERAPVESLSDEDLVKQAIEERMERARTEKMQLKSQDKNELWTDYIITSHASGKSYRVALRGWGRGESYCFIRSVFTKTLHIDPLDELREGGFPRLLFVIGYLRELLWIHAQFPRHLDLVR